MTDRPRRLEIGTDSVCRACKGKGTAPLGRICETCGGRGYERREPKPARDEEGRP